MIEAGVKNHRKVLIVDDDPFVLRVLTLKLENDGYQVETASNGSEAQKKFQNFQPTMVITDINMPVMDGQELCQRMQEHRGSHPLSIIVITASLDNAVRSWASNMKNIYFVEKPISPRRILKLVNEFFSSLEKCNARL